MTLFTLSLVTQQCAAQDSQVAGQSVDVHSYVVPIQWDRFANEPEGNQRFDQIVSLLLRSARYNLSWIEKTFELNEAGDAYVLKGKGEQDVRPACSVVYGMGVILKTGIYDASIVGVDEAEARERTLRLLRGIVRAHGANSQSDQAWGVTTPPPDAAAYWQSALWASLSGMGGWLQWDDLDPMTQRELVAMLAGESRRFIEADYQAPYWNGEGGDTKAEENSWNSMLLTLSAAMMHRHPEARLWKERCSELMISSYSTRADWKSNEAMIDGRPVKRWLHGYNAEPGGVVVNHGFIHPDYMVAISMNFWGVTTQSLAGRPAPQAWDFNAPLVYDTCISKRWDSPPHQKPGGTIYVPGKPNVYYPAGNDWSYHDLTLFYLMDTYAHLFSWHEQAGEWMDLRAGAMLKMQERHDDRHMFAVGEYDTYPGAEQWAFWCLTDAFLPQWLAAHDAIGKKQNWLAADGRAKPKQSSDSRPLQRIAFGSCANQTVRQPIWDAVIKSQPDLFLFLGDTVYADSTDPDVMKAAYDKLGAIDGYQKLTRTCPILAVWDDHDYGTNDLGGEHPNKKQAQQVFLDFFDEPADSPVRRQEGVYRAKVFGPLGRRVQVIMFDTRYHRGPLSTIAIGPHTIYQPNDDQEVTLLGDEQWRWFEQQLMQPAEIRLIVSSIQIVPDANPLEKWANLPHERRRLFQLLQRAKVGGVILLTGDQHLGELSLLLDVLDYDVYELTSSGLTHTRENLPAPNRHRLGRETREKNFGLVTIDWDKDDPTIELSIRNGQGNVEIKESLRLGQLQPTPAG